MTTLPDIFKHLTSDIQGNVIELEAVEAEFVFCHGSRLKTYIFWTTTHFF